jgi:hypothetical protein
MKQSVYLHIGPHKTGTTSLQHYLSHNRTHLSRVGWLYPKTGCPDTSYGHHNFARAVLGRGAFDVGALRREIDNSDCTNVIISSEILSLCRDPTLVVQALDRREVKVVVYCRRQDELLLSMFNERVKRGTFCGSLTAFATNVEKQSRLNHYELCARWAAVFGDDHVLANIYRSTQSIIPDFFQRLGIERDRCTEPPRIHANRSVDPRLIGALRMVGRLRKEGRSDAYCHTMLALIRSFEARLNHGRKYSLMTIKERQDFLARYADSNAKLRDRFARGESFDDPSMTNRDEIKVGENSIHHFLFKYLMSNFEKRLAPSR